MILIPFKPAACESCDGDGQTESGASCQECCEHLEHDHGICNDCEAEVFDRLAARAEEAWEGDR